MLVALQESWSPRSPVRVAGLTRFPGPQISETRRLWHQLRGYVRITVPSLLEARDERPGFREPIAIESRDEIGALARSFNWMASQLRQMEETKQEFFATVSHELRSPLTSIRGAVDLLHGGGPLTEKQERLTDIIGQDRPPTGRPVVVQTAH